MELTIQGLLAEFLELGAETIRQEIVNHILNLSSKCIIINITCFAFSSTTFHPENVPMKRRSEKVFSQFL